MRSRMIEAVQSAGRPGNWGKFLVGVFDEEERGYASRVAPGRPLVTECCGWWGRERVWVLDLQTGEGAYFNPGGLARADLDKHRIHVCVLYLPFLEWLYGRYRLAGGRLELDGLPDVVELPDAEFAFYGYRRPGPEGGACHGDGTAATW